MNTFIKTPKWVKNKKRTINPQTQLHFLSIITKLIIIHKAYQRLNHL